MNQEALIYLISFIAFLASLVILFRIIKRTEGRLRSVYTLLSIAIILLAAFSLVRILGFSGIFDLDWLAHIFLLAFSVVVLFSIWRMEWVVRDITDRGQVLMLILEKDYVKGLIKTVKRLHGSVCYVSLMKLCDESRYMLGCEGVNLKKFHFVGLSGPRDRSSEIIQDPKKLSTHLVSELGEKSFDFLVVDDLSSLKLEPMELEGWISQITAKARATRTQSIFICKKDRIPHEVIEDLEMFMDKLIQ